MSEPGTESTQESSVGIPDEQLPEDLQPTEDNPLAQELPDDVEVDLSEGRTAEESDDHGDDDPDDEDDDGEQ